MKKLTDVEFSERLRAYITDPRHRKTSTMWVDYVDGVLMYFTTCTICGAENRVTEEQLREQGPTLIHRADCAADRSVHAGRSEQQVMEDAQFDRFRGWWLRPENHLVQVGTDVDDRVVLNCVACDAELRLDALDIGATVRFSHAPSCQAKGDRRSVPEVDRARPGRPVPEGLVNTPLIEMLDAYIDQEDADTLENLSRPQVVSLYRGRLNALEAHRRHAQRKLDEVLSADQVAH